MSGAFAPGGSLPGDAPASADLCLGRERGPLLMTVTFSYFMSLSRCLTLSCTIT